MDKETAVQEIIKKLFDLLSNRKGLRHLWNASETQGKREVELALSVAFLNLLKKNTGIDTDAQRIVDVIISVLSQSFAFKDNKKELEQFKTQVAPNFYFTVRDILKITV